MVCIQLDLTQLFKIRRWNFSFLWIRIVILTNNFFNSDNWLSGDNSDARDAGETERIEAENESTDI